MIEITGEVQSKEREQIQPPGSMFKKQEFHYIPILRLRVMTDSGNIFDIIYKGETPGDVRLNDRVTVRGVDKGGVIHAVSIYNETTDSLVTGKSRNCAITTAVYGSCLCEEIDYFLIFRDEFIAKTTVGREMINFYYLFSPAVAEVIKKSEITRKSIRILVIVPLLWIIKNLFVRRIK